jgi:hypothetical protein
VSSTTNSNAGGTERGLARAETRVNNSTTAQSHLQTNQTRQATVKAKQKAKASTSTTVSDPD